MNSSVRHSSAELEIFFFFKLHINQGELIVYLHEKISSGLNRECNYINTVNHLITRNIN